MKWESNKLFAGWCIGISTAVLTFINTFGILIFYASVDKYAIKPNLPSLNPHKLLIACGVIPSVLLIPLVLPWWSLKYREMAGKLESSMFGFAGVVFSVLAALMMASWQINDGVDGLMGVKTSNSTNGYPVNNSTLVRRKGNQHSATPDPNYNAVNDDKARGETAFNYKITTGLMTTNAILLFIITAICLSDVIKRIKRSSRDSEAR